MITDVKNILNLLFEKMEQYRSEIPSAGTRFRLMGIVADITEVSEKVRSEVLKRVSEEAVLDVDIDIDYTDLSEQVLARELEERSDQEATIREQTVLANEALGELSDTLVQIANQLTRHHREEEFAKLFENEKRRYMNSGTARRARQTFEEWKDYECYGHPLQEQIEDYRLEKILQMFEKGVFDERVEHIQRAKKYPGELDFDQLDDDRPMKRTAYRHYAALRKLVDYQDGLLLVDPVRVGRHFYATRHHENAKTHRTNFLKYMHKVELAQQEYLRLQAAQREAAKNPETSELEQLNFFAPTKNLEVLLTQEWFKVLTTDENHYTEQWTVQFVDALMHTEWGEQIARDWAIPEKRQTIRCMIIGTLKDAGVLKGSYNFIANQLDKDNAATLAKYMGLGKKQPYAEWVHSQINT